MDTISSRTKKFGDSFLFRTSKKWNSLPAHVFPTFYAMGSFKRGVKKHLTAVHNSDLGIGEDEEDGRDKRPLRWKQLHRRKLMWSALSIVVELTFLSPMGTQLSTFFSGVSRFFEYPVKRKPICFYRQEDFTATGEPNKKLPETQKISMTDYDKLVDLFYTRLAEQRQYNQEMKEKDRRWSMQKMVKRFPGWNEVAIANLHSLFLLFDNQSNGMLGFDDFGAVLESLGDETAMDIRKEKFSNADTDNDGWITYDEFLSLVYNFHPQETRSDEEGPVKVTGLAAMVNEVAENIQFVSNLTVGEQLEYGLF